MTAKVKAKVMGRLSNEMRRRQWNVDELAEHLDESTFTVNKWLQNGKFPRPTRARKVLLFLTDHLPNETYFREATIGEKLYLLRQWEGVTLKTVSIALGISHTLIGQWEKNQRTPADNQLRKLLRYYDFTAEDIEADIEAESFGDRLQEERIMAEKTQFVLSNETNISPTRLSHFENNKLVPKPEEVERLAQSLDLPVLALVLAEDGSPFDGIVMEEPGRKMQHTQVHITYTQRTNHSSPTY